MNIQFFYKDKGAISVFLVLILVPVLLISGLATDAARIYTSRLVISNAGDMALNAGLAQYEETLHDKYGLFVMEETPEAMSSELKEYFDTSLNGGSTYGDYEQILHLITESFSAVNIEASNICKTEVEKQQIIEYMKYRAPVCLTELVLEKFEQLKDTKKTTEVMEKEVDFVESMDKCQDSIEEAKKALDSLNESLVSYANQPALQTVLDQIQQSYKTDLSKALLMLATIQNYTQKSDETDLEKLAQLYIDSSKKVNLSNVIDKTSFEAYMNCLYYDNAVNALGGIKKLNEKKQEEEKDTLTGNQGNNTQNDVQNTTTNYQKIIKDYNSAKNSIAAFPVKLRETANAIITDAYNQLRSYDTLSGAIRDQTKEALKWLKKTKDNFEKAQKDWTEWFQKTSELSAGEIKTNMQDEVDHYKDFFTSGDGGEDIRNLDALIEKVEQTQTYFEEIHSVIPKEKFFKKSIAETNVSSQYSTYFSDAQSLARASIVSAGDLYTAVEDARKSFSSDYNYEHVTVQISGAMHQIADDPFYKKLQEYTAKVSEESEAEKEKANGYIEKGAEDASVTAGEEEYNDLSFDWSSVSGQLISTGGAESVNGSLTDIGGTVNNSSERKSLITKYKDSIKSATNFLDGIDKLLADNLENLYIAEYAMQMFSCYTSHKDNEGNALPENEVVSISGYKLSENTAYPAEIEYILLGNSSSKVNVRNIMLMTFGLRLLFNSIFAFTNQSIRNTALASAQLIAGATPYLVPIVKVIIQFALAAIETGDDMSKIKDGKGVTIIKTPSSWATYPANRGHAGDNTSGVTFNYQEYLRVFLNVAMIGGKENTVLARIADCIQVNTPEYDLRKGYTMLGIQASVRTNTTFIGDLSDWAGSRREDMSNYSISYNSILGY
ncbi:MAG: hypothetical protein KH268_06220 [Clostridiales bacterium]|nr:hypothetical protein [Clostridiales bacterium]